MKVTQQMVDLMHDEIIVKGEMIPAGIEEGLQAVLDLIEPDLSEIAVHRDPEYAHTLGVYAWCVTCNAREVGTARFARGATSLAQIMREAQQHFASTQHRGVNA